MKRDFLTNLELAKETVDKIMAEHGKAIQTEKDKSKAELEELQNKLTEANNTLQEMTNAKADSDKIQQLADEYKQKYEETQATLDSERKTLKIKEALTAQGGSDLEYLMYKLGDVEDVEKLEDLVKNLKEQLPSHFEKQEDKVEVVSDKLDKVEQNKTYSFDELATLSAKEINDNWDVISQTLSK